MTKPPAPAFNAAADSTMTINRWDDKIWRNDQGKLHRLDGPAVEHGSDTKEWFVDGKRHRLDGPAIEYPDGTKVWFVDGKRHRLDGPAIERTDGDNEWWIDGKALNAQEVREWKKLLHRRAEQARHQARLKTLDQLAAKIRRGNGAPA